MVRLRIDKKGFDKGVEDLRQALRKCTVSDAIQAWGCVHGAERDAKLAGQSEQTLALIVALENVISFSRQRK